MKINKTNLLFTKDIDNKSILIDLENQSGFLIANKVKKMVQTLNSKA